MAAVFAVVLQHATHAGRIHHPELGPSPVEFPLQIGASTLVVISAYFACASLARGRPSRFLRSRLARLLPAYLVAAVVTYAVLRYLTPPGWSQLEFRDLVFNLLMLQNWLPDVRFVDYSYWTLSVQLIGYLAAAALFVSRLGGDRALRAVLWLLPTAPLVLRLWVDEAALLKTVFVGLAMHRAHLFAVGVAIWLWSTGRMRGWQAATLIGVALVAQYVHSGDFSSTAGMGVLVIAIAVAAGGPDWDGVLMAPFARLVHWLAGISYGVFLLNQEIGYVLMYQVHLLGGGALSQVAAMVGGAVLLGWLLTRLVEQPAHRALMRRQSQRQAQGGSVGSRPSKPVPVPRPVNQPSSALPSPRTDEAALFGSVLLTAQLR